MKIEFNGTIMELSNQTTLEEFLLQHRHELGKLLIEHNDNITPRDKWTSLQLKNGDKIVALSIVGGG